MSQGVFFEAVCQEIDPVEKTIKACFPADSEEGCFKVPYDTLVLGELCWLSNILLMIQIHVHSLVGKGSKGLAHYDCVTCGDVLPDALCIAAPACNSHQLYVHPVLLQARAVFARRYYIGQIHDRWLKILSTRLLGSLEQPR